ncbi:MAG: hypothetical protein JO163_07275 [Methylobacteriaceae bacterium]|nr:hypothetical protein [Methylobacteriaceae bacterium]MBV9637266.1 hypothetical protein [Methylobacteriaceae bacterium]MBV9702510.1 hypothetical protein [Methylobacteriaceae bacterium]
MRKIALSFAIFVALLALAIPEQASAQNDLSWVSSTGSNSNPCTRAMPCASLDVAVTKTNPGGEISCADEGDFGSGAETEITKSITIDCEGVHGRYFVDAINIGFFVNAGPNDVVVLRGLDIYGTNISLAGIEFAGGGTLRIEKCVIHDFSGPEIDKEGWGIVAQNATAPYELFVSDTILAHNGTASSGGGILISPTIANSINKVVLNRVEVRNNYFGIKADGTQSFGGGVINMTIRDSVSSGNASNGIVGTGNSSGPAILMMIDRSASSHNAAGFGVIADGSKTTIRLGGSSIAGNINGVGVSNGGVLESYGTNQINGNSNDGIASLTPIGLH